MRLSGKHTNNAFCGFCLESLYLKLEFHLQHSPYRVRAVGIEHLLEVHHSGIGEEAAVAENGGGLRTRRRGFICGGSARSCRCRAFDFY